MKTRILGVISLIMLLINVSCSSDNSQQANAGMSQPANKTVVVAATNTASANAGLSDFQMEHGIGPITEELKLEAVDVNLAKKGEKTFETKCFSCHRLNDRYVGPPLVEVTKRRKPEYIMNMILNPNEMVQKHPVAKKLLAEFMTPMTFQNVTKDDARAILEYFRHEGSKVKKQ